MMSEKNARLYCCTCKQATNHVKMPASQGQAKIAHEINECYLGGNKTTGDLVELYAGFQGMVFEVGNGVIRYFLGKSAVTYWMCEACESVHERYLED